MSSAPSASFDDLLAECDRAASAYRSSKLAILGDLNCDLGNPLSPQSKLLLGLCNQLHLQDIVQLPTCVTYTTLTRIDTILTNAPDFFSAAKTHPFGGSDHLLVTVKFHPRGLRVKAPPKVIQY